MENYKHIFKSKGYLYRVFGGMVEGIEDLENYKIVLATRDPRDILVSIAVQNRTELQIESRFYGDLVLE